MNIRITKTSPAGFRDAASPRAIENREVDRVPRPTPWWASRCGRNRRRGRGQIAAPLQEICTPVLGAPARRSSSLAISATGPEVSPVLGSSAPWTGFLLRNGAVGARSPATAGRHASAKYGPRVFVRLKPSFAVMLRKELSWPQSRLTE